MSIPNRLQSLDSDQRTALDLLTKDLLSEVGRNIDAAIPWVDAKDYTSLNGAITSIGSTPTTLVVSTTQTLTANLTIPTTLALVILRGGSIVKASTYTLTINGSFTAGLYQVFSGFSSGNVTFGSDSIEEAYPEWWTNNTVPGTTDMTVAINSAIAAFSFVRLSQSTYAVPSGGIVLNQLGITIMGSGYNSFITSSTGTSDGIILIDGHTGIPEYRIYAKLGQFSLVDTATSSVGIKITEVANVVLENIHIRGFTTGLKSVGALIYSVNNCIIESCVTGIDLSTGAIIPSPSNLIQFRDCQIIGCSKYAIKCVEGASVLFTGCEIEADGTAAQTENVCDFTAMGTIGVTPAVVFDNCWFEGNHGGADVYYRGTNQFSGINIINTAFYSTDVNYNIDINTATAFIAGVGCNAVTLTAVNGLIGSDVAGVWWSAVGVVTNNSLVFILHNASSGALNFPSNIVPQFDRQVKITPTTNQLVLGTTRTVTITAPTPATSSRTWTLPDLTTSPTVAALEGTQIFSGSKDFSAALGLSSGQINFPATQVASSGANVLDDYEEGTTTATITCGTSGTITLNSTDNKIKYTKVGRAVHITAYLLVDSVSSPVGSLTINGLPFTSVDYAGVGVWCDGMNATAITTVKGFVNKAATTIILQHFAAGVAGAMAADIKANTEIMLGVTYFV